MTIVDYASLEEFAEQTRDIGFLFGMESKGGLPWDMAGVLGPSRVTIHRFQGNVFVSVISLSISDIATLAKRVSMVFVKHFGDDGLASPRATLNAFESNGIRIFFPYIAPSSVTDAVRQYALIGTTEFLVSSIDRLLRFPRLSNSLVNNFVAPSARLVFVLDLVQDFEILRSLMLRASQPSLGLDVIALISDKTFSSYNWKVVSEFLTALGLPWKRIVNALEIADELHVTKSILLTASESNAPAHLLVHSACKLAPTNTIRVTMQHGYENIGLRQHLAHDRALRSGVRFASDVILTWDHPDELPSLHPMERDKCVPVGIMKGFAEDAARARERKAIRGIESHTRLERQRDMVLIAENLHSVRFSVPSRYQRFLDFIKRMNDTHTLDVMIRSHPAIRKLQTGQESGSFRFLDGPLTVEALQNFTLIVSPPSTILLDAVLASVAVAVWTDSPQLGDVSNYIGLSSVTDSDALLDLINGNSRVPGGDLNWAVQNTCSLNGVPKAWNTILQLAY